jgi:hypothetical protein
VDVKSFFMIFYNFFFNHKLLLIAVRYFRQSLVNSRRSTNRRVERLLGRVVGFA